MDRSVLLREAAGLIETAAKQLDTRAGRCSKCGQEVRTNLREWRAHLQIEHLPEKLRSIADRLDGMRLDAAEDHS